MPRFHFTGSFVPPTPSLYGLSSGAHTVHSLFSQVRYDGYSGHVDLDKDGRREEFSLPIHLYENEKYLQVRYRISGGRAGGWVFFNSRKVDWSSLE